MKTDHLHRLIARIQRRVDALAFVNNRVSVIRTAFFLVAATIIVVLTLSGQKTLANWGALLFALVFIALVFIHRRIKRSLDRFKIYAQILEEENARRELDWEKLAPFKGSSIEDALPHYFSDLDIIGEYSLLRLIDSTVSSQGFQRLRNFFDSNDVSDSEILMRQNAVKELLGKRLLRRRLLLVARIKDADLIDSFRLKSLVEYRLHDEKALTATIVVVLLQITAIILFSGYMLGLLKGWFLFPATLAVPAYFYARTCFKDAFPKAVTLESSLGKLSDLFGFLEKKKFAPNSSLQRYLEPLLSDESPGVYLRKVKTAVSLLSFRVNPILHVFLNGALSWEFLLTLRLESVRKKLEQRLPAWLESLASLEALNSLATWADLNSAGVFPKLISNDDSSFLEAKALAHPLLLSRKRVANDFTLARSNACILITGSNMSGKSTFLRTIGINVLLAKAGTSVVADSFCFRNLALHTSLRVADSLEKSLSSFYAEVKQIKSILDAASQADQIPILYLIDEIFRGTSNRERLIGSQACVKTLASTRSAGLVTTHDLELAQLEGAVPNLVNMHFREHFSEGKMEFTYHLEKGPSPSTNALFLMAREGLPIPLPS